MSDDIDQVADDYFTAYLGAAPTEAHLLGEHAHAARFEEVSRDAEDREVAALRDLAGRAQALDEASLDEQQRITRAVLVADAGARVGLIEARLRELGADPIFGEQSSLPLVLGMLAVPDPEVAEAMVSKMAGIATFFRDYAERHREGVAAGRTPAAFAVTGTVQQIDAWLATPIEHDPFLGVQAAPEGVDADRWHERLRAVVQQQVRPAAERYRDVLRDEVLPHARPDDRCGVGWLADGADVYDRTLRYYL